ncbi:MAG TPA: LysR family transcriptional regulator [Rhizobiaceae bacterium]|nr:LysR family transcriptional regulator [Rhizobiaceae bacterium]
MQLDSDLLRTFVAISDTGNFTRAADQVGRTQSAVSMQMKRLEDIVGETLFERGSRGVTLTRKGNELLANARRIVGLLDETVAQLSAPPLDGPVRIGIPEEYGYDVLTQALAAFAKRHPNVEVSVNYGYSSSNLAKLKRDELDLAIVFEWTDFSDGEVLRHDPTVWVMSMMHDVLSEKQLPIALYEDSGWCRDFALKSLERMKRDFRIAYRSGTTRGLELAVRSGFAIAPISRSNIPAGCRELGPDEGFGDIDKSNVVLHRNPKSKSQAVDGMVQAIREAFHFNPAEDAKTATAR